jgi:hypothetical protein
MRVFIYDMNIFLGNMSEMNELLWFIILFKLIMKRVIN